MTALITVDLSAAFDVIDHPNLLRCFEFSFGIKEKALTWLKSYLADKTQCVSVTDITSPDIGLLFGVPQGSVLVYMTLKQCHDISWDDISSSLVLQT